MEWVVVIEGQYYGNHPLPGWNEALSQTGRHPKAGGRMKHDYMMVVVNAIRKQLPRGLKIEKPITLHYEYYDYDRKRDPGNLLYADKVFADALQVCGVIKNDGQKEIYGISIGKVHVDKSRPRVEVTITEVEEE